MLADIVSKNGNMLLSVPVRADGTIDGREEAILDSLATWMETNGECIFGTRPWHVYGEGPDVSEDKPMQNAMGFNETKKDYEPEDMRFTTKGDCLYVILFKCPGDGRVCVTSLAGYAGRVRSVRLLGHGRLKAAFGERGMEVGLPDDDAVVPVLKVELRKDKER